jgi:exosortase D (VPLPA-CTERM-specific)
VRGFSFWRLLDFRPMTTVSGREVPATAISLVAALLALALCALLLLFRDSLELMIASWRSLKHSHGFLMPWLAIYLLGLRAQGLADARSQPATGAWLGLLLLVASIALLIFGQLSAVYTVSQFGFIVALWGLLLSATGLRHWRILWLPLLCMAFMVPLPQFLSNQLLSLLQLLAALLGALLIRAAGFAVVLEGNFVDVGVYQIPVIDACSSVLMVLPLFAVALPAAALLRGDWWRRGLLLLFAVCIPIMVGAVRLAATGLVARYQDVTAAEYFLNASAGAPVYLSCAGLLLLVFWRLGRSRQRTEADAYAHGLFAAGNGLRMLVPARPGRPLWVAVLLIAAFLLITMVVSRPSLRYPERRDFASFPWQIGDWRGREGYVDATALASLKLADHLTALYRRPADRSPVSLWVAWYDYQVHGASVHSPLACLPGAGWRVEALSTYDVPAVNPGSTPLRVNRAIITLGTERQLVYYWFAQRGRQLTSEYLVKWFIFSDGLLLQRSDGALIRLTTGIDDITDLPEADARLTAFTRSVVPVLGDFVPGADARLRNPLLYNP